MNSPVPQRLSLSRRGPSIYLSAFLSLPFLALALSPLQAQNASKPNPPSAARKAANALQDKRYAAAEKQLTANLSTLADKDKNFTADQLLHLKARAQFLQKKYPQAEQTCDALIDQFPNSPWRQKSIFLKAETHSARNNYEQAIAIYEQKANELFASQRKAEIASALIGFAQSFVQPHDQANLNSPAPDHNKAYQLYAEVLDLNCGHALRDKARYQMTRMLSLSGNYTGTEKNALNYLKEFDPSWRGLIGSPERVTMKQNATALATGTNIASVRLLHAEALHRLNRRPEADSYLFELISLAQSGKIQASKAMLADASWLRLQTLRKKGGTAYDIDEWKLTASEYLKTYPDHIHANKTAYLMGSLLNRHQKYDASVTAYQEYIDDHYNTSIKANALSQEQESASEFEARKKLANSHLEAAHFAIGQVQLQQEKFDLARKTWSETTRLFPNGSKWAECQKGLVEIDYKQLTSQLRELQKSATPANELLQAEMASKSMDGFIERYPLDVRIASLLFEHGYLSYQLGKKLDSVKLPLEQKKQRQDKLYQQAMQSWKILLSKYGQSNPAKRAKFLTGNLWEEHFANMEKAIEIYKSSKDQTFRTRLASLTSKRLIASTERVFSLTEKPKITLNTRNIEDVTIHQYWLDIESYFLKNGDLRQATDLDIDLVEPDHSWQVSIENYQKHHPINQQIDIPFPNNKPGICIIKVEDENYFTTSLVVRSNIDISVRSSRDEIIAYATNWATGKPAAHVRLLLASGEKIISTERTGADGVFKKKFSDLAELDSLRVLAISEQGSASCHQSLSGTSSAATLKPKAWFHTATSENRPGHVVQLYGIVRDAGKGSYTLPKKKSYQLVCRTNKHNSIFSSPITLNDQGGFKTEFKIPNNTMSSHIDLTLSRVDEDGKELIDEADFHHRVPITRKAPYRATLSLRAQQSDLKMGAILKGKVLASYQWGAPVSHRRVRITLPSGKHNNVTTDARGEADFSYDTTGIASGAVLHFSAKIMDTSCREASLLVPIDPLQLYIQAESNKAMVTRDENVTIKVATRNAQQKPIGAELSLKLIQSKPLIESYSSTTQSTMVQETVIREIDIVTDKTNGQGQAQLNIKKEGRYILRIEGTDANGKPSLTETAINVLGENTASTLTAYHHTQELHDDSHYNQHIFSKLETPAKALLTIEADRIISYQLIELQPGNNTVKLPLSTAHAPIFRTSIMCMHKRKFYAAKDIITVSRKLQVKTTLPKPKNNHYTAGEKLELEVEVTGSNGEVVPALLMTSLNAHYGSPKNLAGPLAKAASFIYTPFQRSGELPEYAISTSCDFSHTGTQQTILAALKEEEQRLVQGEGRAHRNSDLSRIAQQHFSRVDQVKKSLYMGEGYYNLGKYDQAEQLFKQVLRADRYNKSARRWLEKISATRSDYNQAAYDQTRAQLLNQVDQAWELPNQVAAGGANIATAGLRSGDFAVTRNSIDAILNSPSRQQGSSRNSIDFYLNNPQRASDITSNALALGSIGNGFAINPNRVNQPVFGYMAGGSGGNGGDQQNWINPVAYSNILGIPPHDAIASPPELPNAVGTQQQGGIQQGSFPRTPATPSLWGQYAVVTHPLQPHWAGAMLFVANGSTRQNITLPNQAGQWKINVLAADHSGRLGIDSHSIKTSAAVTLRFTSLSQVTAKDNFSPRLSIYRRSTSTAESYNLTGFIQLNGKTLQALNRDVSFKKGESSQQVALAQLTAAAKGHYSLQAELTHQGKKYTTSSQITIRPEGAPLAARHTQAVTATSGGQFNISLTAGEVGKKDNSVQAHYLNIQLRKNVQVALIQLATASNEPVFGWPLPCREAHPSGQLLAQVAVLDYLKQQGASSTTQYQQLKQQAQWTFNELIELRRQDGTWSSVQGRKRSNLLTTCISYEALQRWKKFDPGTELMTDSSHAWLKERLGQLNNRQLDDRCLIQHALSYGNAADFSICNRLYRDRASLGDAGRILLAQAFINLNRPAFAQTLIDGMQNSDQWTSQSDPLTRHPAWLAGRALSVFSALATDKTKQLQADRLYQTILAQTGALGFTNDYVRGAAVAGLAAWSGKADPSDFEAEIFLNGKSLRTISSSDLTSLAPIFVSDSSLLADENSIKTVIKGTGKLFVSATLTGFRSKFPAEHPETFQIKARHYYHEGPHFKGQPLRAIGKSAAKEIEFQKMVRVHVLLENQLREQKEVALIEHLPAGFTYMKGSLHGSHSGARVENGQLIVTFQDNFKPRWIHYNLIASHPGTWHQAPSTLLPMHAPHKAVFGEAGSLTVLPKGRPSRDTYQRSLAEHKELAQLHYQHGENKQALEHLAAYRQLATGHNEDAEMARITLWLESGQNKPDAKLLVEAFETLDAKMPELSIPFDKILKVGQAYQQLKEYERGHYVFAATMEAGFAQDAYVGAALEDQGRFLDAIDYQKAIWQLYPDNGEITNTWFAMAQELIERSSKARKIKPRLTDDPDTRIKEVDLIRQSQSMLDQFLYLHPEHPSADDVSYTMANTLFALKDYRGVVSHARRCHQRYPKSRYLSSFRYMEAVGSFWLRDYDVAIKAAAEVAHGDSQDKNLATFITAQIFHAKGQPAKAMEWYEPIKHQYPDALESMAYFEQKKISLDEVQLLPTGKKATLNLKYRNVKNAQLKIYRVDLMKLYLKQKNLSNITHIQLAGIKPKHELSIDLPQGDMTEDLEKSVTLPISRDGAYLIICRGDYLYSSGLVLISPLKMEVQEDAAAASLRVHIKDSKSGKLVDNVHVKAIGSTNHTFQQGETDLRGIWKAEKLSGKPTVIARDGQGRYAFFRSEHLYGSQEQGNDDVGDPFGSPQSEAQGKALKIDFNDNLNKGQLELNTRNTKSYNQFRRGKGKGVKVNKAMKK